MKCIILSLHEEMFLCKGAVISKRTTFMVDIESCIIIVKNVPSQVCTQCEEVSYNNEIAQQLEKIVASLKESITEIAVVNYADKIA